MAVLFFLVVVALVVVAWALIAYVRGSAQMLDPGADLTQGHRFPSEKGEALTLLQEDLSFAERPTEPESAETESR